MMKERNLNLDIIRGIAAYSVVANHVLSHFAGFDGSVLGNINFSLQNPLFMMVSGWALIYAKPIAGWVSFKRFIKKRTVLLLLPWIIWSLLKFGLLSSKPFSEYVGEVVYHMEGAYWFLFSLWIMNLFWAVGSLVSAKWQGSQMKFIGGVITISLLLSVALFVTAYATTGISFLGTKFTVYYMPFFLIGWIMAILYKKTWSEKTIKIFNVFSCLCLILYALSISKINVTSLPDSLAPLRMIISVAGCVALFGAIFSRQFSMNNAVVKCMSWGGQKTLELYVVHYIVLGFLQPSETPITTIWGFAEFVLYLGIVLLLTVCIIALIDSNHFSRNLLFGKFKI